MSIRWQKKQGKKFHPDAFERQFKRGVQETGRRILRDFQRVIENFETVTVIFDTEFYQDNYVTFVKISTDNEIFYFLDRGTDVRYAQMDDEFSPQTERGFIGSHEKQGGLLYVDPEQPHPGIEAREYEETIALHNADFFVNRMNRAMRLAVRESGHAR